MKFAKLAIGKKFVVPEGGSLLSDPQGPPLAAYEKKSLSSAYILDSITLERTSSSRYFHKTFVGFSGALEVHPLA